MNNELLTENTDNASKETARIKDLLPIGSVVLLKDAEKALMIFGIKQIAVEEEEVEYDYIGVFYPEGNMSKELQFLFNHEDIAEVLFTGYENDERKEFIEAIEKAYVES